jgi:ribosomal protein S21
MIVVYVPGDGDMESAIWLLKKAISKDGILKEIKGRRYFMSNREKNRLKEMRSRARRKRLEQRRAGAEMRTDK